MDIKRLIHNRKIRTGLCAALILAILMGLWIPGAGIDTVQPQEPTLGEKVYAYDTLTLGETEQAEESDNEQNDEADRGGISRDEKIEDQDSDNEEDSENAESESKDSEEADSEETLSDDMEAAEGNDGQEDGTQGEAGGEVAQQTLGSVMTWYKYGKEPMYIVCGPSGTVTGNVNTAQLKSNELKYKFSLTGEKAKEAKITEVSVKEGNAVFAKVSEKGKITVDLPNASIGRDYVFQVKALWKTKDADGRKTEEEVVFTYEIHCAYAMDLELDVSWKKANNETGNATIAANESIVEIIESYELEDDKFIYSPELTGKLAKDAKLVSGEYHTASGESGTLDPEGGTLKLKAKGKERRETYYLTFTAEAEDEEKAVQKVYYHMTILYLDVPDLDLSFTWLEKGMMPRTLICQPDGLVSTEIKNNQLSAGAVTYEIALTGADSKNARILNISYESEAAGSGTLTKSGSLPIVLPTGYASNEYTITAEVLSEGRMITYKIKLCYVMDVQLEMIYAVKESGVSSERTITCENGKTEVAEAIYDDELNDGMLSYKLRTTGAEILYLSSISCYQSGNGRMTSLEAEDRLRLLLDNGRTGENTFRVTAKDKGGAQYEFCIMVPYKHRGEKLIKINTNMIDGKTVTNETNTNLSVTAWSEDESGNVVSYIPANGKDTKLIVKLDGKEIKYISSSGPASEYILYPENPATGDNNEHILYIYAEDEYGNYGELTLTLKGRRQDAGQKKGTATIRIDMTVLGMGVVDSLSYEVLANEPISYSIAKAVLGEDTGEPFGKIDEPLGWNGLYSGTLDTGFYLKRLTPGLPANVLDGSSWNKYGSNEKQILQAIDAEFGEGTGLATLWRCIYRNGLNKSSGSDGSYGEHDFTNGSGWLYSLNGTYYPGLDMSEYRLEDGDVLTLRYTLAHGWDIGGGTVGYGNTIGYCVTAMDGKFFINHQMEEKKADNITIHVCRYCGLEEECLHKNAGSKDHGDGTHVAVCEDCGKTIGDPELHVWQQNTDSHMCTVCGTEESHHMKEIPDTNTATCTEAGTVEAFCTVCSMTHREPSDPIGHKTNNRWNHTKTDHYQRCSVCKETIPGSEGVHQYVWDVDDWYCIVCAAGHDWDYCGNTGLPIISATCMKIIYRCAECGFDLEKEGNFPEHHHYENGTCSFCGEPDPENPGEPPDEEEINQ